MANRAVSAYGCTRRGYCSSQFPPGTIATATTRFVLGSTSNTVNGSLLFAFSCRQTIRLPEWQLTVTPRRSCRREDPTPTPDLVLYRADPVTTKNATWFRRVIGPGAYET